LLKLTSVRDKEHNRINLWIGSNYLYKERLALAGWQAEGLPQGFPANERKTKAYKERIIKYNKSERVHHDI